MKKSCYLCLSCGSSTINGKLPLDWSKCLQNQYLAQGYVEISLWISKFQNKIPGFLTQWKIELISKAVRKCKTLNIRLQESDTTSEQNKIYPQFILVQWVLKMCTEPHTLTVCLFCHSTQALQLLVAESGTRNMVLPTLLYQMYCQDLGPLHLLIVQSNLDSCFSYAHHFVLENRAQMWKSKSSCTLFKLLFSKQNTQNLSI